MTHERTYTLIERDFYTNPINTIRGLVRAHAELVADILRASDAYQGDRPRTVEIEPEPTEEERLHLLAAQWLGTEGNHTKVTSGVELAAVLRALAERALGLGSQPLAPVWVSVDMQVICDGPDRNEQARRDTVDRLSGLIGLTPESLHNCYRAAGPQVKAFTPISKLVDEPEASAAPLVHRNDSFWKGDEPGSCGASCACGLTFDGFDSLAEASGHIDRHIERENAKLAVAPQPIAPERVDELLAELNRLTKDPDANGREPDWWDWIGDVPEFDREATASSYDTGTLHLTDGTVLAWQGEPAAWKRALAEAPDRPVT